MKIISTVALTDAQRAEFKSAWEGIEIADRACRSLEEMSVLLESGCDVLLTFRMPEDPERHAPNLKWIQLLSAGADHTPKAVIAQQRYPVTTASGIHATPIAEYVIASMLAYAHRLHILIRAQLRREWLRSGQFMSTVDTLRGKTVGIIGYGSIGRETARLAAALGMTVLALKREPQVRSDPGWSPAGVGDPEGVIPQKFFGPDERDAILRESDYVVVTLPLTDATRGFIGERELAAMKPGAYIVNIGRGEVIDQEAMINSLKAGRLGGAGLDVFAREPLEPDSALWDLENAIMTPHMSGSFRGYFDRACELFAENLRRFREGHPLLNRVDGKLGY